MDPQPENIGPYRITARLATGGMAEVYLARRQGPTGLGPKVAVKRLLPNLARDAEVVRMFLNEARITQQISHPNVVKVLEVGDHEGLPYLAMELLEGATFAGLRDRAAERAERVSLPVALRILIEASRGLDAAHWAVDDRGQRLCIVHRDFTPDNIHVGVDGHVKVLDFGIAKSSSSQGATEPGTLKGKYFYMSPEMIAGETVDHRADVFAAGAMLYEQLCGRRPFTGNSTGQVLFRISAGELKRPTEFDPSVPLALEAICLKALSRDPASRFSTLAEMGEALEREAGIDPASAEEVGALVTHLVPVERDPGRQQIQKARLADPSLPSAPLPRLEPPSLRQRLPWIPIAVVALLVGLGAAWLLRPRPTPAKRLATALSAKGEARTGAIAALATLGDDPRSTASQLRAALHLMLEADQDRGALTLAEAIERRWPKDEEAWIGEARAATALGMGKRAETALDRAQALAPKDPRPDKARSELLAARGDLPGAIAAAESALGKDPDDDAWVVRTADLLVRVDKTAEADAMLEKTLARKFDPKVAAERALVALQRHRAREAVPLLRRAIRESPHLALAHYLLGVAQLAEGARGPAEREFLDADRLDPNDTRALRALIDLYLQQHRDSEANAARESLQQRTRSP